MNNIKGPEFAPNQIDILVAVFDDRDNWLCDLGGIRHVENDDIEAIKNRTWIKFKEYLNFSGFTNCTCRFAFIRPEMRNIEWVNWSNSSYTMISNRYYTKAFISKGGTIYSDND